MNERERKLVLEKLLQEQNPDSDDADCQAIAGTLNVPEERVRNVLNTVRRQKEHGHKKVKKTLTIAVSGLVLLISACLMIFSKFWLAALSLNIFSAALLIALNIFVIAASCIVLMTTVAELN